MLGLLCLQLDFLKAGVKGLLGSLPACYPALLTVSSAQPSAISLASAPICSREYSDHCPRWLFVGKSNLRCIALVVFDTLCFLKASLNFSLVLYLFSFFLVFFPLLPSPQMFAFPSILGCSHLSPAPSSTHIPLQVSLFTPLSASFAISAGHYQVLLSSPAVFLEHCTLA